MTHLHPLRLAFRLALLFCVIYLYMQIDWQGMVEGIDWDRMLRGTDGAP